jgi:hypothetical protein
VVGDAWGEAWRLKGGRSRLRDLECPRVMVESEGEMEACVVVVRVSVWVELYHLCHASVSKWWTRR